MCLKFSNPDNYFKNRELHFDELVATLLSSNIGFDALKPQGESIQSFAVTKLV